MDSADIIKSSHKPLFIVLEIYDGLGFSKESQVRLDALECEAARVRRNALPGNQIN